jgi:hypothetical protein
LIFNENLGKVMFEGRPRQPFSKVVYIQRKYKRTVVIAPRGIAGCVLHACDFTLKKEKERGRRRRRRRKGEKRRPCEPRLYARALLR